MYKIALIDMPFAAADIPSIALTQLKSVVKKEMGERVSCDVFYLNLDFLGFLGLQLFQLISVSVQANTSGLGDWFFSAHAFPQMPDRSELYLNRHFSEQRAELAMFKSHLMNKRRGVGPFLDSLIERYKLAEYSLVGFTSMFSQNVASIAMAKELKRRRPGLVTAMGGANCETMMGAVLARNVPEIDFVFSGPALKTFPRFVRHLLDGEEAECHRIPGVLSRRKLALTPVGQWREIGEELDIDEEVALDYDDYFQAFDRQLRGSALSPKLPFETSRGCWWGERSHCTFCGLNGMTMKYRAMKPAAAVSLLNGLFERYGSRVKELESVDNILPREYLSEVLPHLATPPHMSLFYEIKADLKEHEMAALARAGIKRIQPGIEALSTSSLKLMKKGTSAFQNLRFLMYCEQFGVTPAWNLLVGFPDEPESVYRKYHEDLPLFTHLYPPSGVYPVRFDRFSPYHKLAQEYRLKLKPADFYGMIYPFPAEDLENLAYFFRDENFRADYITNTARWLGKLRERVAHWQTRWNRRDGGLKPELAYRQAGDGTWVVYDSRSGRPVEHRVGPAGLRVLGALGRHRKLAMLAESAGGGLSGEQVAQEVESLRRVGLLFEEDGYCFSLVTRPQGEATPFLAVAGAEAAGARPHPAMPA